MCVEESWYFIDWPSWSVNGPIILSNLWLEYGLSSNQTRTNDIRNVVLLVVDPSSIHHYIFGLTNTITVFTWWWKSSDMEIPMSCCWAHQQHFVSPMIHVEHQPSVENFISNAFVFRSWSLCLDGRSDFLEFMCFRCKLPPWIWERFVLLPLESSQVSHACAKYTMDCEISYLHSICIPSTPSHWLSCSEIKESV